MKSTRRAPAISAVFLAALAGVAPAQETWTSHGPTGVGWVSDVAVGDSAAYAATVNGVFRSGDGGASWQQSGFEREWVSQVVTRPGAAVVLAIVRSGNFIAGQYTTAVLYASWDEGKTWSRIPGLPSIGVAAIDPWHPTTIFAGADDDGTLWESTDSGASWQRLSTNPAGSWTIAFAFDSRAVYVQRFDDSNYSRNFYNSLDDGATWRVVQLPIESPHSLAAGTVPGVVYAKGLQSFCRSADSAATWTCTSSSPASTQFLAVIPGDTPDTPPRILDIAIESAYLTNDEGATWARAAGELESIGYLLALAYNASGSLALLATSTGIFRSQDRGDSWTRASAGLTSSAIFSLAIDPRDSSTVWADTGFWGSSSPHLFRSQDGGFSWSPAGGPGAPLAPGTLVIDPEHSSTLFAGGSRVYRSDDGGEQWTSSALPGNGYAEILAVDPGSPERVWAGSPAGLFPSGDGARTWEPATIAQRVYSILFDQERPGTIYAGSYFDVEMGYYGYPYGGSIFVSRDSGANWTKSLHDVGSPVYALALDPFQNGVLYAGTYMGVFRSDNDGTTWEGSAPASTDIGRVVSLVADPVRPGRLYATTDLGVYRTVDGARTWQSFPTGLWPLRAEQLLITPDGRWLYAGTNGGGVFELDLEARSSFPCEPSGTRLCLVGNRYAVDLVAARRSDGRYDPGAARPLGDRAGYFGLPSVTGDPDLPEVVVKMLGDGAFGYPGAPLFYSSLTTVSYRLTVTDTMSGEETTYVNNPDAPLCGATDLFGAPGPWDYSRWLLSAPAAVGETALQLLGGRFSVTLEARHPRSGLIANGVTVSSGDRFGIFSLPGITGDPQFPEVVVKMVDARSFTGKFWFFHTGLTSLDYTLTVTDSVTGAVRIYERAAQFCGGADTNAFTD